jgi:hypothetical protein
VPAAAGGECPDTLARTHGGQWRPARRTCPHSSLQLIRELERSTTRHSVVNLGQKATMGGEAELGCAVGAARVAQGGHVGARGGWRSVVARD